MAVRSLSDSSTDLKKVLADKIPKEQERIKAFRKQYGATKVGEVTVDMVCYIHPNIIILFFTANKIYIIFYAAVCFMIFELSHPFNQKLLLS